MAMHRPPIAPAARSRPAPGSPPGPRPHAARRELARRLAVCALAVAAAAAAAACGDPGPGYPAPRPAVHPFDGQLLYPVGLDDRPGTFDLVVDTGAVVTALDERLVRDVVNGVGRATLDLGGGLRFADHRVFAADLSKAEDYLGVPIHGLLGQDILQTLYVGLDYRAAEVTAASPLPDAPPPGFTLADRVTLPVEIVQGLPIVEVSVAGAPVRLVADTGSGVTLLTESSVPGGWLAGALEGYVWHTSYGSDPGRVLRLPDVSIAGHPVPDTWAVVVPDHHHLAEVFDTLGLRVAGFLGYPVYRRFYVGLDGPGSRFLFYPYPDLDHIPADEWDRVGVELRRDGGDVVVDTVYSPSDASALGVTPGDVLETVDGRPVAGLPLDAARLLLRGVPGESRDLGLSGPGGDRTLRVRVDRLLPPLP